MIFDYETLKVIWWLLIGVLLIGFAITDGFDMGIGVLLPFLCQTDDQRRVLLNAVGPTWESNQVWLVTAVGALFAAWPLVYATVFSGLYFVFLLILFALFLRPVGFDYRSKLQNQKWRSAWDWGLFIGAIVPATVFGIVFGNVLQGVPFHFDSDLRSYYTGNVFALINSFSLLSGIVSLTMLVLHGAVYLQIKSVGVIAERCKKAVLLSAVVLTVVFSMTGFFVAISLDGYRIVSIGAHGSALNPVNKIVEMAPGAWLDNYQMLPWLWIVPASVYIFATITGLLCWLNRPGLAFITSSITVAGIISTAGISMFPFLLPSSSHPNNSLTIWDASSSYTTLKILFWCTVIFLPIVIAYTSWVYRVMRGKVTVADIQKNRHSSY